MKKIISISLVVLILVSTLVGCEKKPEYTKYDDSFFDTFDTITMVVAYTKTKEEFDSYMETIHNRFIELHKLYDRYNDYEGINNIKTINDNAGIRPVKVEEEIIDMLLLSKEWYHKIGEEMDVTIGPVIDIWAKYRNLAEEDPENAQLPSREELVGASKYMDINKVIIDEENSTVYLEDPNMALDVGSIAKGYATELVAREVEELGLKSALISAGGNIRAIGKPLDNERERWGIGIQNPDKSLIQSGNVLETVFVKDASVVSSGDYQRYYMVGDMRVHHIIDPKTLMPGDHYRAVTVVTADSGLADLLSTSIFLLPFDESLKLVESLDGVEALWVMKDGTIEATDGMKEIMYSQGATGSKEK
ncbi:FAD:protein FMN transferase [Tissierellaceae bacterium HCP3S3_D8]